MVSLAHASPVSTLSLVGFYASLRFQMFSAFCHLSVVRQFLLLDGSDVQADHLRGRHLQLLVNTGLQVLIQQRLKFFVLLVEQASLLNEVLPLNKLLVVLAQGRVQSFPHRLLLHRQDGSHLLPVDLLLPLLALSLLLFTLEVALLLGLLVLVDVGEHGTILTGRVERVQSFGEKIRVQSQGQWVIVSLLIGIIFIFHNFLNFFRRRRLVTKFGVLFQELGLLNFLLLSD